MGEGIGATRGPDEEGKAAASCRTPNRRFPAAGYTVLFSRRLGINFAPAFHVDRALPRAIKEVHGARCTVNSEEKEKEMIAVDFQA